MKKIEVILDKIYKYRFVIAVAVLIILILLKLNGSSTSYWNLYLGKDENEGVLIGRSRQIRHDEYVVNTMMAFSQYENNFGFTSNILRGSVITNMFMIYGQPVKDIAIMFRLFLVGYLFLSPERGLSFFWWSRFIALFLATFEFAMLITNKNKKLSLIVTMLVTFSPLVHWWFAVNNLVEMIVFAEVAIVLVDKYLVETNFKKRIILSLLFMLCAGNYMFCTYPAWLIPATYIFLPSAIWVFYKNRKNIKFTKKDVFVLVLEILVLVGLVLRVFIKSADVIEILKNTAYPGKRISTGGEIQSLIQLITENINLITPYTYKLENPCELAVFIDFFPITILLIIVSIIKNKTKDFLFYFMIAISILLSIYCIIGFPEMLAKITFLSYSLSNRVKGIIGLLNIFILARLLAINKENVFCLKISILISLLLSIVIGEYIRFLYKDYFELWQFIAIDILSAIIYFLILQAKDTKCENLLVLLIAVFSIISVFGINPLRIGTPIYKSELGQTVKEINNKEPGTWVTAGINGNFLLPFGANCLSCVHTYPNMGLWEVLDPDGKFDNEYNRYADVIIEVTNDDNIFFNLISEDAVQVFCNIDNLDKINVKYICTKANYDNKEMDTNLHKLEKIDYKEGFNIYKIVNV